MKIKLSYQLLAIILLAGIITGALVLFKPKEEKGTTPSVAPSEVSSTVQNQEIKEIQVIARQWQFEPSEIRVKRGERVRLRIKSVDVTHGFSLPAYNINVVLTPGKEEIVEFVADKSGEFEFACSVQCGAGHAGMRGKIIIE